MRLPILKYSSVLLTGLLFFSAELIAETQCSYIMNDEVENAEVNSTGYETKEVCQSNEITELGNLKAEAIKKLKANATSEVVLNAVCNEENSSASLAGLITSKVNFEGCQRQGLVESGEEVGEALGFRPYALAEGIAIVKCCVNYSCPESQPNLY